ncbi:Uncharacterised protein [Phocaeicola vulgatus]|nr:Uncharacterised protein [Phocaeicola vulgatus]
MVAADSGSRSFTVSVCFVLVLVFRFLIFSLSGFPALFHRKSCHVSPFPPFAFCYPFLRCSSLRIVRLSSALFLCFIIFSYYNVRARVCGDAASFASLQVCLPFFPSFLVFRLLFSYGSLPFSVLIRACEYYNVCVFFLRCPPL